MVTLVCLLYAIYLVYNISYIAENKILWVINLVVFYFVYNYTTHVAKLRRQ